MAPLVETFPSARAGACAARMSTVLLLLVIFLCTCSTPGRAVAAQTPVPSCRFGAYLGDLYDVKPADNRFSARLRVWSLCRDSRLDPIPNLSTPNGSLITRSEQEKRSANGWFWDRILIDGEFRQDWDLHDYPFDKHSVTVMFTAPVDETRFHFEPDAQNSDYSQQIRASDWKITGMRVVTADAPFKTTFGDPSLSPGEGSTYSRVQVVISLVRADHTIFWQLAGPVFIIFLVTLLTFLLSGTDVGTFQGRITALGASLFAVVVNMEKADAQLPPASGLTLIDQLHLLTLGYVLLAIGITVICWRKAVNQHEEKTIARLNRSGILAGVAGYMGGSAVLIGLGILHG